MKALASNAELYKYLQRLETSLRGHGYADLAENVARAARTAAGMSTEFLGESRNALGQVSSRANKLNDIERMELEGVLKQLDVARRVSG